MGSADRSYKQWNRARIASTENVQDLSIKNGFWAKPKPNGYKKPEKVRSHVCFTVS